MLPATSPSPGIGPAPGNPSPQPGAVSPVKPPFGSSPSVTPTHNAGLEVAGMQRLGVVIRLLTETLPMVGATSEVGGSVLDAIKTLSKHVRPGAVTPAAEANQLQKAQFQNAQNSQMLARLRQPMPGGGTGGGQPGMPPQAPSAPAMAA